MSKQTMAMSVVTIALVSILVGGIYWQKQASERAKRVAADEEQSRVDEVKERRIARAKALRQEETAKELAQIAKEDAAYRDLARKQRDEEERKARREFRRIRDETVVRAELLHSFCMAYGDKAQLELTDLTFDIKGVVFSVGANFAGRPYIALEGVGKAEGVRVVGASSDSQWISRKTPGSRIVVKSVALESVSYDGTARLVSSPKEYSTTHAQKAHRLMPQKPYRVFVRSPTRDGFSYYKDHLLREPAGSCSSSSCYVLILAQRGDALYAYKKDYPSVNGWIHRSML